MKIRYGIVSTATIVPRFVQGVKDSDHGVVHAICSRSLKKAEQMAKELDIMNAYGSYEELLQDKDIDIVYIPTPNYLHYEYAKKALLANKHVLLEKPFTLSLVEAEELFTLAQEKNKFIMEAQKAVFLPITNKIKELIEQNVLGDIRYISMHASFPGNYTFDHWMYSKECGGGALFGSNAYTVEYLLHLFDVKTLQYEGICIKTITGIPESCQFQFVINHNIVGASNITMNVKTKNEAVIYGTKGYIEVENYWKARKMKIVVEGNEQIIEYPCPCEFVYEVNHVNECLLNQCFISPIMTKEKTLLSVRVTEKMNQLFQNPSNDFTFEISKL